MRPCRSSGSPSAGRRRRKPSARSRSSSKPWPKAIALPASRPCWRTRKRRCLPSPTVDGRDGLRPGTSSVTSGLPSPKGASRSSSWASWSVRSSRGDDGIDRRGRVQVLVGEVRVGVRGECLRERLEAGRARSRGRRRLDAPRSARGARSTRRARRAGRSARPSGRSPSTPSCEPVTSTTGRWNRSTRREATIPITPSCQSSLQRT